MTSDKEAASSMREKTILLAIIRMEVMTVVGRAAAFEPQDYRKSVDNGFITGIYAFFLHTKVQINACS